MATWTTIPDANLDPDSPVRSVDGLALRDNPIAIAERATDAPWVGMPRYEVFTSNGTFNLPDEINSFEVLCVGGGGAGQPGSTPSGGDTSVTYNSVTVTAGGGVGGASGGAPGSATGADLGVPGQSGGAERGGNAGLGYGHGGYGDGLGALNGGGYGGGGGGGTTSDRGGGGGAAAIKVFSVVSGVTSATVTVGIGGTSGGAGGDGADGVVIIRY